MVAVGATSEDCLFLDLYVPDAALHSATANTPVVVWIHGGAFLFGSKNHFGPGTPFYTGEGMIEAAAGFQQNVIWVAGNYRLGAFGWLAGPSVEAAGKPNAGLYDQRLLLQWVQDFIGRVGGDKAQVSVWGQSAGAGSIVHHLVQAKGARDPLFKTALMQSPAFQWQWDRSRNGTLDSIYHSFAGYANCTAGDIMACLRGASTADLSQAAQQQYDLSHSLGLFPFGPAIDDVWLSDLPSEAFAKGA
jgi:carboxylesterase type B